MLHTFANKCFFFFCSGISKLNERQKFHMKVYFYLNYGGTFLDIINPLKEKLVEFQKNQPCEASKEALGYRVMNVLIRTYTYYILYKCSTITYK